MQTRTTLPHGVTPPEKLKGVSGLEFIRGIIAGDYPPAPMMAALQYELIEADFGRAVFAGEPVYGYYNPIGSVHGGYAATLLDSCMGCAVHTILPAERAYTTLEFKINFVRAMSENTGRVRALGQVVHAGSRVATAEGRLVDAAGKLLAHASTTCMIFPA